MSKLNESPPHGVWGRDSSLTQKSALSLFVPPPGQAPQFFMSSLHRALTGPQMEITDSPQSLYEHIIILRQTISTTAAGAILCSTVKNNPKQMSHSFLCICISCRLVCTVSLDNEALGLHHCVSGPRDATNGRFMCFPPLDSMSHSCM